MSNPDSAMKLKPIQLAALVILMAEAREVANTEFYERAKFTLTGKERTPLEALGLIESRKIGQTLPFQLTDKGWAVCKQLYTTEVNVGNSIAARSIFVLLDGLGRSLNRLHVSHADFFKQPAEAEPAKPVATASGDDDVEARIRAGYAHLPKSADGWV